MDIIRDVPVEVYYDNENLVVTGVPETVNMTIKGPANLVQSAKLLKDFTLKVDLRSMPMGRHTVQIQTENISNKINVELDPATIEVDIEEKITQSFRVDPEMNDKLLAEDYELVKMEVEPSTIEVTGAKSIVDSISFVKVSVSGENGIDKSFEQKGRVRVLDRDLNKLNVSIEPEEVTVKVDVEAYHKEVPISVKQKGKTKEGVTVSSLTTDEKMVTLYGPRKTLEAIDQLNVDIDVSELSGSGKQSIVLPKPKGVLKMSVDKVNVNIDVKVSAEGEKDNTDDEASAPPSEGSTNSDVADEEPPSSDQEPTTVVKKTRQFSGIEIRLQGLDKRFIGSMVKPSDGLAAVTVTGEEKVIDALTESDVIVLADAKSVNHVGEHVLPISVQVPSDVQYEVNFKDITVMVEQA